MSQSNTPSDLETQALSILWSLGPSTVTTVIESFPDGRERAYTTILSVMQSLEKKKLVKPSRNGRANVYAATKSRAAVMKPILRDLVDHAFNGSVGDTVSEILSAGALTPEEKAALGRELTAHKAMAKKKTAKKKAAPARKPAKKAAKKVAKKVTKKKAVKKAAKKATKKATKKAVKKAAPKKAAKKAVKKKVAKRQSRKSLKKRLKRPLKKQLRRP